MRFIKISGIFLLLVLLPVDAILAEVEKFMHRDFDKAMTDICYNVTESRIAFHTDLMNATKMKTYINDLTASLTTQNRLANKLVEIPLPNMTDDEVFVREYERAGTTFPLGNNNRLYENIKSFVKMDKAFNTAKVCPYNNQHCNLTTSGLSLTEIEDVMAESRDYDELLYLWKQWREATAGIKTLFNVYFNMQDLKYIAKFRHIYSNNREVIKSTIALWREVEPLYLELHKYVSRKLKHYYGDQLNISDGLLPAHVLGTMWAESWYHIEPLVRPFPNVSDGNLEYNLNKTFSVVNIFRAADEFYQSMGLSPMRVAYEGPDQMLTKPTDGREVMCYPTSSDYCNGTYRVTMCGKVDLENFIKIHHELGHIQYFTQYREQPYFLRDGASPAFHETVGEPITLSVTSPRHLKKLGLLTDYKDTYESSINFLMKMALIKVPFLPFSMIAELWKLNASNRLASMEKWNSQWWEYRMKYQRIKPPVPRSDATDFDAVSKYLLAQHTNYFPYFDAHFMGFQIYKALCLKARESSPVLYKICPLHDCDFYKSREAGKLLGDVLRLGYMKPRPEVLEMLTKTPNISSTPFLEYFQPLYEFLKKENEKEPDIEKPVPHIMEHVGHPAVIATVIILIILILFAIFGGIYCKYLRGSRFRLFLH